MLRWPTSALTGGSGEDRLEMWQDLRVQQYLGSASAASCGVLHFAALRRCYSDVFLVFRCFAWEGLAFWGTTATAENDQLNQFINLRLNWTGQVKLLKHPAKLHARVCF